MICKGRNINPISLEPLFCWPFLWAESQFIPGAYVRLHPNCVLSYTYRYRYRYRYSLVFQSTSSMNGAHRCVMLTKMFISLSLLSHSQTCPTPLSSNSCMICMPWICRTPVVSLCTAACKWKTSALLQICLLVTVLNVQWECSTGTCSIYLMTCLDKLGQSTRLPIC